MSFLKNFKENKTIQDKIDIENEKKERTVQWFIHFYIFSPLDNEKTPISSVQNASDAVEDYVKKIIGNHVPLLDKTIESIDFVESNLCKVKDINPNIMNSYKINVEDEYLPINRFMYALTLSYDVVLYPYCEIDYKVANTYDNLIYGLFRPVFGKKTKTMGAYLMQARFNKNIEHYSSAPDVVFEARSIQGIARSYRRHFELVYDKDDFTWSEGFIEEHLKKYDDSHLTFNEGFASHENDYF